MAIIREWQKTSCGKKSYIGFLTGEGQRVPNKREETDSVMLECSIPSPISGSIENSSCLGFCSVKKCYEATCTHYMLLKIRQLK